MPQQPTNHWQKEPWWKQNRASFNQVAEQYDTYRPSYPAELVQFVINSSQIPAGGKILEIGCGTGIATRLFASRGYSMVCVEPGVNLVGVARESLAAFHQVSFEISSFEDWPEAGREFDLVLSAQAFHWVPQEIAYAKTSRLLKPSGCLALVWNMYPNPQGPFWDDLQRLYGELAPQNMQQPQIPYLELAEKRTEEIASSGFYRAPQTASFPWSKTYTVDTYLGLLGTYSDHIALDADMRQKLFAGIAKLIESYGGQIEIPYVTYAYVARKLVPAG